MPYINFSEDDLYRANNADLVSYLGGCGGCVKRVGSTYQYVYTDGSGAVKKQKKRLHPEKERMQPFL